MTLCFCLFFFFFFFLLFFFFSSFSWSSLLWPLLGFLPASMAFFVELALARDFVQVSGESSWNLASGLAAEEALVGMGHLPGHEALLVHTSVVHRQESPGELALNSEQGKGALQALLGLGAVERGLTLLHVGKKAPNQRRWIFCKINERGN